MTTWSHDHPVTFSPDLPMPKPTFFNLPADKRQRIVDLALEEFANHPYGQASISRVVEQAGIAKGSFYQYFEDKFDLYSWLITGHIAPAKFASIHVASAPPGAGFFVTIEHLMRGGLEFAIANPRMLAVGAHFRRDHSDPRVQALYSRSLDMGWKNVRAMMERARETGEVRADLDLDLATDLLYAVLDEGLSMSLRRKLGGPFLDLPAHPEWLDALPGAAREALVREMVDLLRVGLGTTTAAAAPTSWGTEVHGLLDRSLQQMRGERP